MGFTRVLHLDGHLEANWIEQFQQASEANRLAVVGRGAGKNSMLEEEANLPQHSGALAGPAAALGSEMMALIDDE